MKELRTRIRKLLGDIVRASDKIEGTIREADKDRPVTLELTKEGYSDHIYYRDSCIIAEYKTSAVDIYEIVIRKFPGGRRK